MKPNPQPGNRHLLDDDRLGKFLKDTHSIEGLKLPVTSSKIGYGQSNPTYFVDDAAGARFVLRKKPAGTIISPVAHQVDREYRVMKALGLVRNFPVPKMYTLCMDPDIIGTPFYVMEFVKGRIITDPDLGVLSPADRRKAWFSMVETLAWMHSLDPDAIGLEGFGKKTGFYARHCSTFSRIEAQQAKVRNKDTGKELGRAHPRYEEIVDYVRKHLPGDRYSIVHGDFKFDNVILHPTEPRVIAVLDWELSTIGHPLMDTVYLTSPFWNEATKMGHPGQTSQENPYGPEHRGQSGMPDPNELMDRYSQIVGFDPRLDGNGRDWQVAQIFHHVRNGTITHGIQARTVSGQASSDFSQVYFENTKRSLDAALERIRCIQDREASRASL